ncbi:transglutaminase family protein [Puniceicoccaceae bacterium K14]|nr:transglutaminase family protein [Puniceicoccaceae bacterium K14]
MARYRIHHKTSCFYNYPVIASYHSAKLKPISNESQSCERFKLKIQPNSQDLSERIDYFDNAMAMFSIQESHDKLTVEAESIVTTTKRAVDLTTLDTSCGYLRSSFKDVTRTDIIDAKQFVHPTEITPIFPEVTDFGMRFFKDEIPIGKALLEILNCFKNEFEFDSTATEVNTPSSEVLQNKRGVCQDYAHLMISAMRACGLSCRYASGYILTMPPEGMPRLIGADASHAWVSVFVPGIGWVDLDPTNNCVCADQHVCIGYGRDYSDVSMLKGAVTGGGDHQLSVEVTMEPIDPSQP